MRYFLLLLLLGPWIARGQNFSYPALKSEGAIVTDFIPQGWRLLDVAMGELNHAPGEDYALVLEYRDSVRLPVTHNGHTDTIPSLPRMLVVIMGNSQGDRLRLAGQNTSFIPGHHAGTPDPFLSLAIRDEALFVELAPFDAESFYLQKITYQFRYRNGELLLAAADNNFEKKDGTGYSRYHYDFLARRWSLTKGFYDTPATRQIGKPVPVWHSLPAVPLKTLSTIGPPNSWAVTEGASL